MFKKDFQIPAWVKNTNIYEVNTRQYTEEGTLDAFIPHLPRLKKMGVQTLWFMPLTPISAKNRKGLLGSYYACSDYLSINPEFGTPDDFRKVCNEAHALGLKVIIDWVANHTGWDHSWTIEHPDFYKRDAETNDFKKPPGMDDIIELDYSNELMKTSMIEAMQHWVQEYDIDGFRCDLAFWVWLDFWKEAREKLERIKPLFWFGEFDELQHPGYGEVFDASYSWTWMHRTRDYFNRKLSLSELISVLKNYDDLGDHTVRCWFTSNHDENSWNGTEYEKYGDLALPLAVFSCTWNGIPLIYSGQEVSNKKRLLFFEKDSIHWESGTNLEDFYSPLLRLRSENTALTAGDPSVQTFILKHTEPLHVFSYLRSSAADSILVILNFSDLPFHKLVITDDHLKGKFRDLFTGALMDLSEEKLFAVEPWGYKVLVAVP
jgi:alpha-amylase